MDLNTLHDFQLERILNQDPLARSIYLLGSIKGTTGDSDENQTSTSIRVPAIVTLQKTPFDQASTPYLTASISKMKLLEHNDIYQWMLAWTTESSTADLKINVIAPATEAHIRKYSAQAHVLVHETPELYHAIVKPYIDAFPPSRTEWVRNILNHTSEADKIIFEDPDPTLGYILIPDMKWNGVDLNTLYLVAIAHNSSLQSMRDLRKEHIPMLKSIRRRSARAIREKWGIGPGKLRLYLHYQPSYYQLHVHVVTVEFGGFTGMSVGQAHLLDDVISLLEVDNNNTGPSIFERMTLSYVLGEQHGLYEAMNAASVKED